MDTTKMEIFEKETVSLTCDENKTLSAQQGFDQVNWYTEDGSHLSSEKQWEVDINLKAVRLVQENLCERITVDYQIVVEKEELPDRQEKINLKCGEIQRLVGDIGFDSYQWTNENDELLGSDLFLDVKSAGLYKLIQSNQCRAQEVDFSVVINNISGGTDSLIRNYFSPNGDGINDTWDASELFHCYPKARILLFDRNFRVIQTLTIHHPSWDGRLNGNILVADDYWYQLDLGDGSKVQMGHFSLIP